MALLLAFLVSTKALKAQTQTPYDPTIKLNYVRTWNPKAPITQPTLIPNKPVKDVIQTTGYFDGLGRPIQNVTRHGALLDGNLVDKVTPIVYDQFGRQPIQYIPYAAKAVEGSTSVNDGMFKTHPTQQQKAFFEQQYPGESFYYSKTHFEYSPLDRQLKKMSPGNSWVGQERGLESLLFLNSTTDDVKIWEVIEQPSGFASYQVKGVYSEGELQKSISIDENGKQTIQFSDKVGKVILKKVQATEEQDNGDGRGYANWVCLYNIYDEMDNLRCVIQPEGLKFILPNFELTDQVILAEQCFRYEYDERGRMYMMQHPGGGITYTVYDAANRPVFVQDENLRLQNKWKFTLYDDLGRSVITGLMSYSGSPQQLQLLVSGKTGESTAGNGLLPDRLLQGELETNNYYATNSITIEPESVTKDGAVIEIAIVNGNQQPSSPVTIEGILINRYPVPDGTALEIHGVQYYDNYEWTNSLASELKTFSTAGLSTYLLTPSDNTYPYPQAVSASQNVKGRLTGSKILVLGSTPLKYLSSVNFYNEEGSFVQARSQNLTDGVDIATSQFAWNGQALVGITENGKGAGSVQKILTANRLEYDDLGRHKRTYKTVINKIGSVTTTKPETEILVNTFDAEGRLAKQTYPPVNESMEYDYNIRGWKLGANRKYLEEDNGYKFAYEIGYDKASGTLPGSQFGTPLYNGNVNGVLWRSAGDGEKRKFKYSYDHLNRITVADFTQLTNGSFNRESNLNFSMDNITYDLNGNIKTLRRYGWIPGASSTSPPIDQLQYNYIPKTNKLKNVIDAVNNTNTRLGDFRSSQTYLQSLGGTKTETATDYTYDLKGNLIKDLNKDLGNATTNGIKYNYLDLPEEITFTGTTGAKGTIKYVYDASGRKLKKIVHEDGKDPQTTTYLGEAVFENDELQFLSFNSGRIRYTTKQVGGNTVPEFVYDYFLKDHLGDTRMVLTEERKEARYYATMETEYRNTEVELFKNIPESAYPTSSIPGGYPADAMTTNPNNFVAKLNGSTNKVGPSLVLRVMAGDKMEIGVKSFFRPQGQVAQPLDPVPMILSSLASGIVGKVGDVKGSLGLLENDLTSPLLGALNDFRNSKNNPQQNVPKAYLNWILFDEQFNFVEASSGAKQVAAADVIESLTAPLFEVAKNGFLYVYVSNETPNYDVFFNDLSLVHQTGGLMEETHYYPFGLNMAGISSRAMGMMENNRKYNGGSELVESMGLNWYETSFRSYDPQLGRFWQLDPMAEKFVEWSPYNFSMNNPILLNDPSGLDPGLERAKLLDTAYVVGVRRIYNVYLDRLNKGRREGLNNQLSFEANDSKWLRARLERMHAYENRRDDMNRQVGNVIINGTLMAIPGGGFIRGGAWLWRAGKVTQFFGNQLVKDYGGALLQNLAKEILANHGDIKGVDINDLLSSTLTSQSKSAWIKVLVEAYNSLVDLNNNDKTGNHELKVLGFGKGAGESLMDGIMGYFKLVGGDVAKKLEKDDLSIDLFFDQLKKIFNSAGDESKKDK